MTPLPPTSTSRASKRDAPIFRALIKTNCSEFAVEFDALAQRAVAAEDAAFRAEQAHQAALEHQRQSAAHAQKCRDEFFAFVSRNAGFLDPRLIPARAGGKRDDG